MTSATVMVNHGRAGFLLDWTGWGIVAGNGSGRELTAPLSGMEAWKRKAGLVPATAPPALAASAVLNLGRLEHIAMTEQSPFGAWLLSMVKQVRAVGESDPDLQVPLTFPAYKAAVGKIDVIRRALHQPWQDNYVPGDSPELRRFAKDIYHPEQHAANFEGYVRYLCAVSPAMENAVFNQMHLGAAELKESDRKMHSYVVGGTGSGKSELLKLLIHHYVQHPELGGVVVLDPHGKLVREVARWREFAGRGASRLVYLDAVAQPDMGGMAPALNPLWRGDASADELPSLAAQLADALAFLAGEGEGQSHYMRRVAMFGLHILLERPGSSLLDLLNAMGDPDGAPIALVGAKHPDSVVRNHFKTEFFSDSYKTGKRGLAARLGGALYLPVFRRMMTAPRPLDLPAALDAGKVVLVNCASAGEASIALGRLVMAQVAALGVRRTQNPYRPKTPVHVFIDEATVLMAPPVFKILRELRKENVFLTMAQQSFADGLDREFVKPLVDNTKVKMLGRSANLGSAFKAMNWDAGSIPKIGNRQFIVSTGDDAERLLLHTASHLVDDSNAMDADDWQAVLEEQFAAYYRQVETSAASPATFDVGTTPAGSLSPAPARTWRRK